MKHHETQSPWLPRRVLKEVPNLRFARHDHQGHRQIGQQRHTSLPWHFWDPLDFFFPMRKSLGKFLRFQIFGCPKTWKPEYGEISRTILGQLAKGFSALKPLWTFGGFLKKTTQPLDMLVRVFQHASCFNIFPQIFHGLSQLRWNKKNRNQKRFDHGVHELWKIIGRVWARYDDTRSPWLFGKKIKCVTEINSCSWFTWSTPPPDCKKPMKPQKVLPLFQPCSLILPTKKWGFRISTSCKMLVKISGYFSS